MTEQQSLSCCRDQDAMVQTNINIISAIINILNKHPSNLNVISLSVWIVIQNLRRLCDELPRASMDLSNS
jgi:hypothetical protein